MNKKDSIIEVSEPTEDEIKQTKEMAKTKYGIIVPKKEVYDLVKIIKELDWWLKLPKGPHKISEEMINDLGDLLKKNHGKVLPKSELYDGSRSLLVMVTYKEKQRLSDEMRYILVKYKKVDYNSALLKKLDNLLELRYEIKLADEQLNKALFITSKTLWYEESLDRSVEECLNDLMVITDKTKRGKRINCLESHDKVMSALDITVKDLTEN